MDAKKFMTADGSIDHVSFPSMDNAGEFFFILGRAKSLKLPIDEKLHEQLEKQQFKTYGEYEVINFKEILYAYKVSGFNNGLKLMMEGKEWFNAPVLKTDVGSRPP
jgi:hypothetical protein